MAKELTSDAKVDEMAKSTFINMCNERSKYETTSQEKTKHDGNIAKLYSSIKDAQKDNVDAELSNQQLEFNKEKFRKEAEQKDIELKMDKERFGVESMNKLEEINAQRYISDREAEVKVKQIEEEKKTSKLKILAYMAVAAAGVVLHGVDVKAEKEGYMTDERVSSFDKHAKGPLSWFGK